LIASFLFVSQATYAAQETLNFVIMASEAPVTVEYPKYKKLSEFLQTKISSIRGINLVAAKDFRDAAEKFRKGEANAMFAGSFVAAVLVKKGLAVPVVRPVDTDGASTYKALVIARKTAPAFKGVADFNGKKVAYCSMASSGEIFALSMIEGKNPDGIFTPVKVPRHDMALDAVKAGGADYAIVKNTAWDPQKYPELVVVYSDIEENPNTTLILSKSVYNHDGAAIEKALLAIENDKSEAAKEVKSNFNITKFTKTTEKNFGHTYEIIKKAKIDPQKYNF
jgi:ABC-type phosphate/phosphonate transport system substrate-binding protein